VDAIDKAAVFMTSSNSVSSTPRCHVRSASDCVFFVTTRLLGQRR